MYVYVGVHSVKTQVMIIIDFYYYNNYYYYSAEQVRMIQEKLDAFREALAKQKKGSAPK